MYFWTCDWMLSRSTDSAVISRFNDSNMTFFFFRLFEALSRFFISLFVKIKLTLYLISRSPSSGSPS